MTKGQKTVNKAKNAPCFKPNNPRPTARAFVGEVFTMRDQNVLLHWNGVYHAWACTCYPEIEPDTIKSHLYAYLDGALRPGKDGPADFEPNRAKVANVEDALKALVHCPRDKLTPPVWLDGGKGHPPALEILACKNGLLHLPTGKLLPKDPAFFNHNALDYSYDPKAPQPECWLKFLGQLWPDDPAAIETLQEMFGYLLTVDTRQQKMFLLVGPKRSGKGTISRILTGMVGKQNVVSPTLAGLTGRFGLEALLGKQVATISDARLGGKSDVTIVAERLLSISGEDAISVERKGIGNWDGTLGIRFVLLTNELPRLADASGSLASRFILLQMTESFYGKEDLGLTKALMEELPGILNWSIEGWRRLQERGHFVNPSSSEVALQTLEDLGSPISAFIRDCCEVGPDKSVLSHILFSRWQSWAENQGMKWIGDQVTFGRNLHSTGLLGKDIRPRNQDGTRDRRYTGVGLIGADGPGTGA